MNSEIFYSYPYWLTVMQVVGVVVLALIAWRRMRSVKLRRHISQLPPADRQREIMKEMGAVLLHGADADAYLRRREERQFLVQIAVSLALLGAALYIILSKLYADADTKWSYGIVGTIIGYWLKGK
jgi:threonine/homoserine/homoserine lactone efflux protein